MLKLVATELLAVIGDDSQWYFMSGMKRPIRRFATVRLLISVVAHPEYSPRKWTVYFMPRSAVGYGPDQSMLIFCMHASGMTIIFIKILLTRRFLDLHTRHLSTYSTT